MHTRKHVPDFRHSLRPESTVRGSQTCRAPTSTLLRITLHIARALGPRLIRRPLFLPLSWTKAPSVVTLLIVPTRQQHQPLLTGLLIERWVRIPRPQHGTGWQHVFGTLRALISQIIRNTHDTVRRPGAGAGAPPIRASDTRDRLHLGRRRIATEVTRGRLLQRARANQRTRDGDENFLPGVATGGGPMGGLPFRRRRPRSWRSARGPHHGTAQQGC